MPAKKTPAQLQRDIDEVLRGRSHARRKTIPTASTWREREYVDPRSGTTVPYTLKTTAETKSELVALRKEFEAQGGRGVDLAERIDELEADLEAGFQESTSKKADWLKATKRRFPVGARVHVVKSDVPEYVGLKGTVADYDLGSRGDWPLIGVKFDGPIKTSEWPTAVSRDSFYDDEIVLDRKKGKR